MNHRNLAVALAFVLSAPAAGAAPAAPQWVAAWSAAPDRPGAALEPSIIRQVVRTTIAGSALRLRLTNTFGTGEQIIGPIRIAPFSKAGAPEIDPVAVTFGGRPVVAIPKGGEVMSDPVAIPVRPLAEFAISLRLPEGAPVPTLHGIGLQSAIIISANVPGGVDSGAGTERGSRFFVSGVDVAAAPGARTFVVMGDSIADGVGSTRNANQRWPDILAERLQSQPDLAQIAVVNAGVAGNRILHDGAAPYIGPSVLSRFDRDALDKPGVRWVLLASGINDITASFSLDDPNQKASAAEITAGMKELADRAHARGIKIWAATLLPTNRIEDPSLAAAVEAERRRVNDWIRASGTFDAVLDFENVLKGTDPGALRLAAEYDSGDHLHPNDKGYRALAEAIDLNLFRR